MSVARDTARGLLRPADGVFTPDDLAGLPEPAARMLLAAIAPGTPRAVSARLRMRGDIRLKGWTPFRGGEVITPHAGFVWAVRTRLISGYDRYADGEGEMRWKLLGLVPVMRAAGPDTSRSAAARVGGEAVWVPTSLLPRFGTRWEDCGDGTVAFTVPVGGIDVRSALGVDADGRVLWARIDRWGDPDGTGTFGLHPFGVEFEAWRTFDGVTIPAVGRAGWFHGTDRWEEGVFFRFAITELRLVR